MPAHGRTLCRVASRVALSTICLTSPLQLFAQNTDAAAMDQLLGPVALYPDPLLAQVLTCSTSPQQVTEFHTWLDKQTLKGSELQKAAMDAGYEASFASLALFPQVVSTLAVNIDWTKELGTAYLSDAAGVMQSVQRLRDKAQKAGTLTTNDQQTVTVENQGGSQTVIIQPTNPQVVYVPQYDPQTVYSPPPQQSSAGSAAVAGLLAFGVGIAIGAAIDNDPYYYGPYGWGSWGFGWHTGGAVVYRRSVWVVPPRPRYPYVRPVPVYHPSRTVVAPRRTNVTVNVNNNRVNVGNKIDIDRSTNIGNRTTNVSKGATVGDRNTNVGNRATNANRATGTSSLGGASRTTGADRGHAAAATSTARKSGTGSTALSGYGNGASARDHSSRGKTSVGKSRAGGGGGRRR